MKSIHIIPLRKSFKRLETYSNSYKPITLLYSTNKRATSGNTIKKKNIQNLYVNTYNNTYSSNYNIIYNNIKENNKTSFSKYNENSRKLNEDNKCSSKSQKSSFTKSFDKSKNENKITKSLNMTICSTKIPKNIYSYSYSKFAIKRNNVKKALDTINEIYKEPEDSPRKKLHHYLENTISTRNKIVNKIKENNNNIKYGYKKITVSKESPVKFNRPRIYSAINNVKKNNININNINNSKKNINTKSNNSKIKSNFTNYIKDRIINNSKNKTKTTKINLNMTYNTIKLDSPIRKKFRFLDKEKENDTDINTYINTISNVKPLHRTVSKRHRNRGNNLSMNMYLTYHYSKQNFTRNILNNSSFSSTNPESCIISRHIEDYIIGKVLGKGSYAEVRRGVLRNNGQKFAIKIYNKISFLDIQKRNTVKNEISILKELDHPNIVKLYEVIDTSSSLYLIMELINGVSLLDMIKKEKNKKIPLKKAIHIYYQILKAISYLQKNNINHRDIKLENILIENENKVKLIDFGFAVKSSSNSYQNLYCGTPSYMSPEIVNKKKYIAQYSDIWSLGVLFFAMIFGCFPFRGKSQYELFNNINNINYNFNHINTSDEGKELIDNVKKIFDKIFVKEPEKRITINELLKDNIFKDIKEKKHCN